MNQKCQRLIEIFYAGRDCRLSGPPLAVGQTAHICETFPTKTIYLGQVKRRRPKAALTYSFDCCLYGFFNPRLAWSCES